MSEWKECKIADAPFEIIDGDRGTNYPKEDKMIRTVSFRKFSLPSYS